MKNWIISVVFIAIITYIFNVTLKNAKTNKVLAFIFSLFSVVTILYPLINLKDNQIDFALNDSVFELEEDYITFTNEYKLNYYKNLALLSLKRQEVILKDITFEFKDECNFRQINKILINCNDLVINENNAHINIKEKTISILCGVFKITADKVVFYE